MIGSREHYNEWHPTELHEYSFEFQEMGNDGDLRCFRCIAAWTQGVDEPVPSVVIQAWAPTRDEAQYESYKRAAYFLVHGVFPRPNIATDNVFIGAVEYVEEDGRTIVRELEFDE